MMTELIKKIEGKLGGGWKTYTAAIISVILGLVLIAMDFFDPQREGSVDPTQGLLLIMLGLSAFGLGNKGARLEQKIDESLNRQRRDSKSREEERDEVLRRLDRMEREKPPEEPEDPDGIPDEPYER